MSGARVPPPTPPAAPAPQVDASRKPPVPLKIRHVERAFGRPRSTHLKLTATAISCRRCRVMVPRGAQDVALTLEHTADCPVFAETAP